MLTFGQFLERQMDRYGETPKTIAQELTQAGHLKVSRTTIQNWLRDNCFRKTCVRPICAILRLTEAVAIEGKAVVIGEPPSSDHYPVSRWMREPKQRPLGVDEFATALEGVRKENKAIEASITSAAGKSLAVFSHMDQRHFFVSTTCTVVPLLLYPASYPSMVKSRVQAIIRGALFGMILPTKEYCHRIAQSNLARMARSYNEFDKGFNAFRQAALQELADFGIRGEVAEKTLDAGIQRIECDEFPLTAPGWTISVLGEVKGYKSVEPHIMIRSPYHDAPPLQLWGKGNHEYDESVLQMCIRMIDNASQQSSSMEARSVFLNALLHRMRGEP